MRQTSCASGAKRSQPRLHMRRASDTCESAKPSDQLTALRWLASRLRVRRATPPRRRRGRAGAGRMAPGREVEGWRGEGVERWRGGEVEGESGGASQEEGRRCAGRAACVLAGRHASRTREEAEKEKPAAQKAVGSGLHGCRSRSRARKRSIPSAPKASSLAARVQRRVARRSCERVAPCASPSYGSGYVVRTGFGEAQRLSMASSSASHPGANLPRRRRSLGRVCAGGRAGVCKSSVRAARACCASRLGGSSPRRGAAAAG